MKVGFTGTREGMTDQQADVVSRFFRGLNCSVVTVACPLEFHHGACVGADAQAALMVDREVFAGRRTIVAHPGDLGAMTDAIAMELSDVRHRPKPPLDRNRDIVDAVEVLVATPKGPEQFKGSVTWATIRYARKRGKRVVIVWTDGRIEDSASKS